MICCDEIADYFDLGGSARGRSGCCSGWRCRRRGPRRGGSWRRRKVERAVRAASRRQRETERQREIDETEQVPGKEKEEVAVIFREYGLSETELKPVVNALSKNRKNWVDFMMRFELGLEQPDPKRASRSALTIALSYIAGGMIPLSPYILISNLNTALWVSVSVTLLALFLFGFFKGRFTGLNPWRSGGQTVLVGGLAAAVAFLLARLIG